MSDEPKEVKTEIWECSACGELPCRVEIKYAPTPYRHVEEQARLRERVCLCREYLSPDWQLLSDRPVPLAFSPENKAKGNTRQGVNDE